MRWALMTYTIYDRWPGGLKTLEEMADFATELGFEALELSTRDIEACSPAEAAAICKARGLSISCMNGPVELAAEEDAAFAAGLADGRAFIAAAAEMSCPALMVIPGFAASVEDKPRAAERMAEGLRRLIPEAEAAGVTVTIEDFPNPLAPYASIAEVRWLLDAVPGLKLTFDNGNWLVGGDDPAKAAQEFAGLIANTHVKDWEIDPDGERTRLPDGRFIRGGLHGQGLLDHRAILSALVAAGYDGYLAFEYEGPMDHLEATWQGMEYLREVLAGIRHGS